jgi:hypothetical protein
MIVAARSEAKDDETGEDSDEELNGKKIISNSRKSVVRYLRCLITELRGESARG